MDDIPPPNYRPVQCSSSSPPPPQGCYTNLGHYTRLSHRIQILPGSFLSLRLAQGVEWDSVSQANT